MKKVMALATLTIAGTLLAAPASEAASAQQTLELFGTPLQGATRNQLRGVLKAHGLGVVREDNNYWVDKYNASAVLDGASSLDVGYTIKTDKFGYAEYTFNGFMNTELVTKVADMVEAKYGRPSSHTGNAALGQVTYEWDFPHGMYIKVSRGWPDTTTYLSYVDKITYAQMQSEMAAEKTKENHEKAKAQSNAF